MSAIREKFMSIEAEMNDKFIERQDVIRGSMNALLSRKNVLVLGAPGTSKSMLARELCSRIINSKYYWYLLTKFTTPEELFGPFSMKALKGDAYKRITENRLPEADIAFLDEIYKGSSAIANTLLTIINERKFENNGIESDVPLQTLFAASNEMPADAEELGAFHDRFHLKYEVQYIRERSGFIKMLKQRYRDDPGFKTTQPKTVGTTITFDELKQAQEEIHRVEMTEDVYELYDKIRFALSREGVIVSDRSFNMSQDVVKAESWLMGQDQVAPEALSVCTHMFWSDPKDQDAVKKVVLLAACRELLDLEKAYDEAKEKLRPRMSQDGKEVSEELEDRKKLKDIRRRIGEGIVKLEKKKLPCYKYKSMLESVRHRLATMEAELVCEEVGNLLD